MVNISVVFDTNALPVYGGLTGPKWTSVRMATSILGIDLRVPDLVVEESVQLRKHQYEQLASDFLGRYSELEKYSAIEPLYLPSPGQIAEQWVDELRSFFVVVPTTGEDACEALTREVRRMRPARGGRGARDSVIWLTVLRLLRERDRVYFVSNNTRDFAMSKNGGLHEDLVVEARNSGELIYLTNVQEFMSQISTPVESPDVDIQQVTDAVRLDLRQRFISEYKTISGKDASRLLLPDDIKIQSPVANNAFKVHDCELCLITVVGKAMLSTGPVTFQAQMWILKYDSQEADFAVELEAIKVDEALQD